MEECYTCHGQNVLFVCVCLMMEWFGVEDKYSNGVRSGIICVGRNMMVCAVK